MFLLDIMFHMVELVQNSVTSEHIVWLIKWIKVVQVIVLSVQILSQPILNGRMLIEIDVGHNVRQDIIELLMDLFEMDM